MAEVNIRYYELKKEYNTDTNPTPEVKEKLKEIEEAYETLGKVNSRRAYDASGMTMYQQDS